MSLTEHTPEPRYVLSLWKGRLDAPNYPSMSGRQIIDAVAALHGLQGDALRDPTYRKGYVTHARQHAMWELRQQTCSRSAGPRWTCSMIARMFWSDMDRSTVAHGARDHAARAMQ